jgi:Aerotolerance regulator N-terminal
MINVLWLNPLALFALAVVAAPIVIHILVQRHAERFPFPTLRFLQPTRLAAIRRHVLADAALLAVRAAILAAAVAALAGPLVVTSARRQAWERRTVRALVVDDRLGNTATPGGSAQSLALRDLPPAFETRRFTATSLPDGARRAASWLETAPPARRELVIVSPFAIGSITAADVAAIPAGIGVRFERSGALPPSRTVPAGRLLTSGRPARGVDSAGAPDRREGLSVVLREATLDGDQTIVRDTPVPGERTSWPIDLVAAPAARPSIDAGIAAVLSQRVWAPAADRQARLVMVADGADKASESAIAEALPVRLPWMANAIAQLAHDADLTSAAGRVAAGLPDPRFVSEPWQVVATSADGRPLVVAAASPDRLLIICAASASDLVAPLLMRSIADVSAAVPDLRSAEVLPIPDRLLREWARPRAVAPAPTVTLLNHGDDDRRWLWLATLCLLAAELWLRRAGGAAASSSETPAPPALPAPSGPPALPAPPAPPALSVEATRVA